MDGRAEKNGRHHTWAVRYLALVGCRLLVFRQSIHEQFGNSNLPLNVIDLSNALIKQESESILQISTHRPVGMSVMIMIMVMM